MGRVGGHLAQVGTPQQLLEEPADAFVEGFVGRDRGYRSLSFQPASSLRLGDVPVVRDAGSATGAEPTLLIDGDARPLGWLDPARPGHPRPLGATFDVEGGTLRTALDAVLTSPVGLAVGVVPGTGRYAGVVSAETILTGMHHVHPDGPGRDAVALAPAAGPAGDDGSGDDGGPDTDATAVRPSASLLETETRLSAAEGRDAGSPADGSHDQADRDTDVDARR